MESKDNASGKETGDYTLAAFKSKKIPFYKMYAVTCTHSSGNFDHNFI